MVLPGASWQLGTGSGKGKLPAATATVPNCARFPTQHSWSLQPWLSWGQQQWVGEGGEMMLRMGEKGEGAESRGKMIT